MKTIQDIVHQYVDDSIGLPPAQYSVSDRVITVKAPAPISIEEWKEIGEELIKELLSGGHHYDYRVSHVSQTAIHIQWNKAVIY